MIREGHPQGPVDPSERATATRDDVESCRFRVPARAEGRGEVAECRLVRQLTGVADPGLCRVSRESCECCCRAGFPTPERPNPVVGSLVYGLAARVVAEGGVAGCGPEAAGRVQRWAEQFLDTDPSDVDRVDTPDRAVLPCDHLGEEVGARVPRPDGLPGRVAVFRCHHPAHAETTLAECDRCRDWTDRPRPGAGPIDCWLPYPARRSGPAVRAWSVGVTTSPRRRPTLEWTLDSLARAGWERARLFVDAAVTVPPWYAHYPVSYRETKLGAWPNFCLDLAELLMRDPAADAYLMVQDDVTFYDRANLREYLEQLLWPGERPGPVSLHSSGLDARSGSGWHAHEAGWFRGALAFIFPRGAAQQLVLDPAVFRHRWTPADHCLMGVGAVVSDWATRNGTPVVFPSPSLCRHIGHASTLYPSDRVEGDHKEGPFGDDTPGPPAPDRWSPDAFPESAFPCPEAFARDYARKVEVGILRMRGLSVAICGLCRDVRPLLPATAARVERLGRMFREYRAVFYENDSTDGTASALEAWAEANPAVHVISERRGHPRFAQVASPERAVLLASYRNRCRDHVLRHFGGVDYVIVADMDLGGGWSYDGIAHSFGHDDWDFIGSNGLANGRGGLYHFDHWAFRDPGREDPIPIREFQALALPRGAPLRPVGSCFGGLGVYRLDAFKAAAYGGGDCEHAVLHRRLRALGFGRLYLNPSQIALYEPWRGRVRDLGR